MFFKYVFMYVKFKLIEIKVGKCTFILANLENKFHVFTFSVPFEYRHLSLGFECCMPFLHLIVPSREAFTIKKNHIFKVFSFTHLELFICTLRVERRNKKWKAFRKPTVHCNAFCDINSWLQKWKRRCGG